MIDVPVKDVIVSNSRYKIRTGMRGVFTAPPDCNIVVSDYSSQELRVAAAVSGDQEMLNTYYTERDNPFLVRPDTGEKYENPNCDLHFVSAKGIFPELANYPEWEALKASKTLELNNKSYRYLGKTCNFGRL